MAEDLRDEGKRDGENWYDKEKIGIGFRKYNIYGTVERLI